MGVVEQRALPIVSLFFLLTDPAQPLFLIVYVGLSDIVVPVHNCYVHHDSPSRNRSKCGLAIAFGRCCRTTAIAAAPGSPVSSRTISADSSPERFRPALHMVR